MGLDESALCIKRDKLPPEWLQPSVAIPLAIEELEPQFKEDTCQFLCRRNIENDFSFKQIIPYVLVTNFHRELLAYVRHGTEARLHQRWSIGVGGHINQSDYPQGSTIFQAVVNGMKRECLEELGIPCSYFSLVGVINEEETEVGHAHLGIVYTTQLPDNTIPSSAELGEMRFLSPDKLEQLPMELWSKLAISLISKPLQ